MEGEEEEEGWRQGEKIKRRGKRGRMKGREEKEKRGGKVGDT